MLTSKQRAKLRSMAQTINPIFQIGKNGITENIVNDVIDAHKFIDKLDGNWTKYIPEELQEVHIEE